MDKIEKINNKIDELKKEIEKLETEKNNIKNFYSVVIIKTDITLKDLQNIKDDIAKIVQLYKDFSSVGVRKLAYTVRGQNEGYFLDVNFMGTNEDITELERYYRINDDIIKFVIQKELDED